MSISKVGQQTQSSIVQNNTQKNERFSISFPKVAVKLNQIAFFAFCLFTLSNIPGADGGPLAYSACVIGCLPIVGGVAGPAAIACFQWCLLLLPLPGP